jgi:hypothetical protein
MRTSTAYFAGVGTVIAAVSAGLGGGYLAANITSPPSQTVSKLERRMSAEPIAVSTSPAEPVVAAKPAAAPAQEQTKQQPQTQQQPNTQQQPQPQIEAAAPPANPASTEEKPANNGAAVQPVPPQPAKSAEQADEKTATPRDAYARARDADIKRADAEKRRAERRQQWADKRRLKQPREQELEAVEERVREMTEPRRIRIQEEGGPREFFAEPRRREMFAEPARSETPRIRLFDQDD